MEGKFPGVKIDPEEKLLIAFWEGRPQC